MKISDTMYNMSSGQNKTLHGNNRTPSKKGLEFRSFREFTQYTKGNILKYTRS